MSTHPKRTTDPMFRKGTSEVPSERRGKVAERKPLNFWLLVTKGGGGRELLFVSGEKKREKIVTNSAAHSIISLGRKGGTTTGTPEVESEVGRKPRSGNRLTGTGCKKS